MYRAYPCICGRVPETTYRFSNDRQEYTTRCGSCQIVFVNGPSETIEDAIGRWNENVKEAVRMIVHRALQAIPELRPQICKLCGNHAA